MAEEKPENAHVTFTARASDVEQIPPCSCYPALSSSSVSSMVYDQIYCKHLGHKGACHRGVVLFDSNWGDPSLSTIPDINDVEYHRNRPVDKTYPQTISLSSIQRCKRVVSENVGKTVEDKPQTQMRGNTEISDNETDELSKKDKCRVSISEQRGLPRGTDAKDLEEMKTEKANSGVWRSFDLPEYQFERKHSHQGKYFDLAEGKLVNFDVDYKAGYFDEKHLEEQIAEERRKSQLDQDIF